MLTQVNARHLEIIWIEDISIKGINWIYDYMEEHKVGFFRNIFRTDIHGCISWHVETVVLLTRKK